MGKRAGVLLPFPYAFARLVHKVYAEDPYRQKINQMTAPSSYIRLVVGGKDG